MGVIESDQCRSLKGCWCDKTVLRVSSHFMVDLSPCALPPPLSPSPDRGICAGSGADEGGNGYGHTGPV